MLLVPRIATRARRRNPSVRSGQQGLWQGSILLSFAKPSVLKITDPVDLCDRVRAEGVSIRKAWKKSQSFQTDKLRRRGIPKTPNTPRYPLV
jgi:hypothetical protein